MRKPSAVPVVTHTVGDASDLSWYMADVRQKTQPLCRSASVVPEGIVIAQVVAIGRKVLEAADRLVGDGRVQRP